MGYKRPEQHQELLDEHNPVSTFSGKGQTEVIRVLWLRVGSHHDQNGKTS